MSLEADVRGVIISVIVGLIVTVCGGMVVSAVLNIKTASTRIQCANNLRQISLALLNYADTHGRFPSADLAIQGLSPEQRLSWLVAIIPYVEADNLYSKMDKDESWNAEENRFAALLRMPVFQCPGYPTRN